MTLNQSKTSITETDDSDISLNLNTPVLSKKKRGAPKGVLRGPRPVYFVGSAIDDSKNLIMKSILSPSGEDDIDLEEISDLWESEYGLKPINILGPFYEKKSNQSATFQKRKDGLSVDLDSLSFSGEKKYGEFNGWEVIVQLLKSPKDYGWIIFKEEIGAEDGKKKQKPASKAVKLNLIDNLRDSE